jgi:hypothetical protein
VRKTQKERRCNPLKKIVIIGLSLILWLGLMAVAVMAQGPGFSRGFGMGFGLRGKISETEQPSSSPDGSFLRNRVKRTCWKDPAITFSEEQTRELEGLQHAYLAEAKPLWNELRNLQLELRFAVSDPRVRTEALLDKQRKFSTTQAKFESLYFSHLIKVRAIFTREQLERLPSNCPLKMGPAYGMRKGMGKEARKGIY